LRKIQRRKGQDRTAATKNIGETARREGQGTLYLLQAYVQGKQEPVHLPISPRSPAGQQRVRTCDPQREGKTENIGTVQKRKDGAELRQN